MPKRVVRKAQVAHGRSKVATTDDSQGTLERDVEQRLRHNQRPGRIRSHLERTHRVRSKDGAGITEPGRERSGRRRTYIQADLIRGL